MAVNKFEAVINSSNALRESRNMKKNLKESSISKNVWYHCSSNPINKFDIYHSNEIGLHCGATEEQAFNRCSNGYLYRIFVSPSASLASMRNDCTEGWNDLSVLSEFLRSGIITREEYSDLLSQAKDIKFNGLNSKDVSENLSELYREILTSKGYQGFTYPNEVEGNGLSICIISSRAIQRIELVDDSHKVSESKKSNKKKAESKKSNKKVTEATSVAIKKLESLRKLISNYYNTHTFFFDNDEYIKEIESISDDTFYILVDGKQVGTYYVEANDSKIYYKGVDGNEEFNTVKQAFASEVEWSQTSFNVRNMAGESKKLKESEGALVKNFDFVKDTKDKLMYVYRYIDNYPKEELVKIKKDLHVIQRCCEGILSDISDLEESKNTKPRKRNLKESK